MNRRLFTPAIVVASFAATFGLLSWRDGLWQQTAPGNLPEISAPQAVARAPMEAPRILADDSGQANRPSAVVAPDEPPAQPLAAPPPEAQVEPTTDQFLAAQDRAAAHSTRSH